MIPYLVLLAAVAAITLATYVDHRHSQARKDAYARLVESLKHPEGDLP